MSVLEASQSGRERVALEAMRDSLAAHMDAASSNVVAQVAARLQAVLQRLSDLPGVEQPRSVVDELARERADRQSKASVVEVAAEPKVQRRKRSG